MGIFSGAFNIATNAIGAAEFGTKGIIAGAGVGLATELLTSQIGNEDNKDDVSVQFARGFVSGAVGSAFSTFQEQYAFKHPDKIQALTSINTTTSASAVIDTIDDLLKPSTASDLKNFFKKTYKDLKNNNGKQKASEIITEHIGKELFSPVTKSVNTMLRPENVMFDIVKQSMITGEDLGQDVLKALNPLYGGLSDEQYEKYKKSVNDEKAFKKAFKKDYGMKLSSEDFKKMSGHINNKDLLFEDIKGRVENASLGEYMKSLLSGVSSLGEDTLKSTIKTGNGEATSPWLTTTKDVVIPEKKIQMKSLKKNYTGPYNGKDEYEFKDKILKEVKINKNDSMQTRMAKYLDRNRDYANVLLDKLKEVNTAVKGINGIGSAADDIGNIKIKDIVDLNEINKYIKNEMINNVEGLGDINNAKSVNDIKKSAKNIKNNIDKNMSQNPNKDVNSIINDMKKSMESGKYNFVNEKGIEDIKRKINNLTSNGIYDVDGLIDYISKIEPGAVGTHRELEKNYTNTKRKIIGTIYEEKNGAPLWAKSVEKQLNAKGADKATIENYVNYTDKEGKMKKILQSKYKAEEGNTIKDVTREIKGGNKAKRGLAMVGDILLGGLAVGASFAVPAAITKPFKRSGTDKRINNISSNGAVNSVYYDDYDNANFY